MVSDIKAASRRRSRRGRRVLRGALFGFLLVIVALLAALAGFYVGVARTLPSLDLSARAAGTAQTTKIFDSAEEPTLLAELHGVENRETLRGEDIPQVMRDATVAIEDERFYSHSGVDFLAILRALWANIRNREIVQGGSTITQQYIKNAFINDDQTLDRKLREAALAYQLEKQWAKDKILNEYLNIIYFGEGAYGVEAASQEYFGIGAVDLSIAQAALLAGLPKAPSAYSPRRDPRTALARRDLVLNKMFQQEYITSEQLQGALAEPLILVEQSGDGANEVPYWIEIVREQLVSRYGSSTVLGGGLRVYTSVDLALQREAERAIAQVLTEPDDPSAALVCVDVRTGRLLAMVGGRDFSVSQFNLATQGRRQPGSAFKPFVLVTALEQGVSPDALYESGPAEIKLPDSVWEVSSSDSGPLSLREATARSSNGVYARLIMEVGAKEVAGTAYDMGIETSLGEEPNPAIALGGLTTGVSPMEMTMAYATLATGGERLSATAPFNPADATVPVIIERVTDADGELLDQSDITRTRVLDEGIAAVATSLLEGVISGGTGTGADIGRTAAGKTGTTSNYRDAWFVGFTPELVTAVWVGYPDEQKAMTDVHGGKVTGGSLPAQIWSRFMQKALEGLPESTFPEPPADDWVYAEVCADSHQLPTELCPTKTRALFRKDLVPGEECEIHKAKEIPVPDLLGLDVDSAEALLTEAGFAFISSVDEDSQEAKGTVVAQTPSAGSPLMQGQTVSLVVSAGRALQISVPEVVGLDVAAARRALSDAGLSVEESSAASEAATGTVISQSVPAQTRVSPETSVEIVVSSGPAPPVTD